MESITADNFRNELLETFPELAPDEAAMQAWAGENPGNHILAGLLLSPLCKEAIREGDSRLLDRAFVFIERMAQSEDRTIVSVVMVSVLEQLADGGERRTAVVQHMGPKTASRFAQVEAWLDSVGKRRS